MPEEKYRTAWREFYTRLGAGENGDEHAVLYFSSFFLILEKNSLFLIDSIKIIAKFI